MWMLHTATRWTLVSMAGPGIVLYVDQKVPHPHDFPPVRTSRVENPHSSMSRFGLGGLLFYG